MLKKSARFEKSSPLAQLEWSGSPVGKNSPRKLIVSGPRKTAFTDGESIAANKEGRQS